MIKTYFAIIEEIDCNGLNKHVEVVKYSDYKSEIDAKDKRISELVDSYNELIMAVAKKYPDETRHQTALRYINSCENIDSRAWAEFPQYKNNEETK